MLLAGPHGNEVDFGGVCSMEGGLGAPEFGRAVSHNRPALGDWRDGAMARRSIGRIVTLSDQRVKLDRPDSWSPSGQPTFSRRPSAVGLWVYVVAQAGYPGPGG